MESVPLQPREHSVNSKISLSVKKVVSIINNEIYRRSDQISQKKVRKLEDDCSTFGLCNKNFAKYESRSRKLSNNPQSPMISI